MSQSMKRTIPIRTVSEFESCDDTWFKVQYGITWKTTHRSWIESWQYRMLKKFINDGRLWKVENLSNGL